MNKLSILVENLYQYHFRNWKGQVVVYALTFAIALLYAIINALMLGRSERSVVFEGAVLTVILLVGLPIAYIIVVINPWASASEERTANTPSHSTRSETTMTHDSHNQPQQIDVSFNSTAQAHIRSAATDPIHRELARFHDMLRWAGPSAMVGALTDDVTEKNGIHATQLSKFLDNLLNAVVAQIQIVVEQEYVHGLRVAFLSVKEKMTEEHIHRLEKLAQDFRGQATPLYKEIERLKEELGIVKGQKEAFSFELNTLQKELATKGEKGLLVSAKQFEQRIAELSATIKKLENEKLSLGENLGKANKENSALSERVSQLMKQKEMENSLLSERISELIKQKESALSELTKSRRELDKARKFLAEIKGYAEPTGFFGAGTALEHIRKAVKSIL